MVLEKTLKSPLDCKVIIPVNPTGSQSWIFIGRTDAEAEVPIFWPPDANKWLIGKNPWSWERVKAGKGGNRGWAGWMALPTWWTWVWASSGSWWWTGKPGVLQSMGSQRIRHDWATELTELNNPNEVPLIFGTYLQSFWPMKIEIQLASVQIARSKFEFYEKTVRWLSKQGGMPRSAHFQRSLKHQKQETQRRQSEIALQPL